MASDNTTIDEEPKAAAAPAEPAGLSGAAKARHTAHAAHITQSVIPVVAKAFPGGGIKAVASGFKEIPVIGALTTAGFVAWEVGANVADGKYRKAFNAAAAGGAEIAGNTVGFGVGDVAREAVRGVMHLNGGAEHAADKSGLRTLVETFARAGSPDSNNGASANTSPSDNAAPKRATGVTIGPRNVPG